MSNCAIDPRWYPREFAAADVIPIQVVRFPAFSVNREKFSRRPEQVLDGRAPTWGIASFRVRDLPRPIAHPERTIRQEFVFRPCDCPTIEQPAHAEVRCFRRQEQAEIDLSAPEHRSKRVPRSVRETFRSELRARMVLLKPPLA